MSILFCGLYKINGLDYNNNKFTVEPIYGAMEKPTFPHTGGIIYSPILMDFNLNYLSSKFFFKKQNLYSMLGRA